MAKQDNDIILQCDSSEADKYLKTGEYKLIGHYILENPSFEAEYDSSVGYVKRRMIYCLINKKYL